MLTGPPMTSRASVAGAGVGPEQHLADGLAVGADGHRRGPLPGDRDGVQRRRGRRRPPSIASRAASQQRDPPLGGVLGRGAVEADVHADGAQRRAAAPRPRASHGDLGAAVAEVDREDPALAHVRRPGLRAPPRAWRRGCRPSRPSTMALPCGVPPKPYIAPDSRRLALRAAAHRRPLRAASSRKASATPGAVLGRVMQKCSAGGSCSGFIRQPCALSASLTR